MNKKNDTITKTVKTGITFGSALANELGVCHLLYN